jgi:flagellar hook-associated protein 1 FlgK
MSNLSLNIGIQGLFAAQSGLDVIGNNLANLATPGYSRQNVSLAQSMGIRRGGLLFGSGVDSLDVNRTVDSLLESRIVRQLGLTGRLEQRALFAGEVESLFGSLDNPVLGSALNSFFDDVSLLSTSPADLAARSAVTQSAASIASSFNQISSGLGSVEENISGQIEVDIKLANELAEQLADLNIQIQDAEAGSGSPANGLRDQRQLVLQSLAELVELQTKEDPDGSLRVFVGGNLLVVEGQARELELNEEPGKNLSLSVSGGLNEFRPNAGRIGGLMDLNKKFLEGVISDLDQLASAFIQSMNKAHSTGVPASGPFKSLVGTTEIQDLDGDGSVLNERLGAALPFAVEPGPLLINVTNEAGGLTQYEIEVDPDASVGDFVDSINGIPGLTASIDVTGRLRISAGPGLRFDFANRLPEIANTFGTFGSELPQLGSAQKQPYSVAAGGSLDFAVPAGAGTNLSIPIDPTAFPNDEKVTAAQMADYLNGLEDFSDAGLVAQDVGGYLHLVGAQGGAASFELTGGAAAAGLGLDDVIGVAAQPNAEAGDVQLFGSYQGDVEQSFLFVPTSNGTVGTTPGLQVEVFDAKGDKIATLDVGEDYVPGTRLSIGDGIEVAFDLMEVSADTNERMQLDVRPDSDPGGVLVGFGLNTLFTGTNASNIQVRQEILDDPDLLATSGSGELVDQSILLDMLAMQDAPLGQLGGSSIDGRYAEILADVGFEVGTTQSALDSASTVLESLRTRRDSVSAVNVDEELVKMVQFEQTYDAIARFMQVINETSEVLLSII